MQLDGPLSHVSEMALEPCRKHLWRCCSYIVHVAPFLGAFWLSVSHVGLVGDTNRKIFRIRFRIVHQQANPGDALRASALGRGVWSACGVFTRQCISSAMLTMMLWFSFYWQSIADISNKCTAQGSRAGLASGGVFVTVWNVSMVRVIAWLVTDV